MRYIQEDEDGLPPVLARPELPAKVTADEHPSKTQEEGSSQGRTLKKRWKSPGFIVNKEGTLEN